MPQQTVTCCFRVHHLMRFPVEAAAGDYLTVMPPKYRENLWVLEPIDLWVVRRCFFPEGKLWTVLADLADAGTLTLEHAPSRPLLVHLVATGQLSAAQAVRTLRAG